MAELPRWSRRLTRDLVGGIAMIGAAWSCGGEVLAIMAALREARAREEAQDAADATVRREAAAGVEAIERYLAANGPAGHDRPR